jgi:hypothetical protein
LCKTGQLNEALGEFLAYSLPRIDNDYVDPTEFLSDPATVSVRNAAVSFVWFHSRPIQDSTEWRQFQKKYFRLRPIFTLADMDQCYAAFQTDQRSLTRERIIHGEAERVPQASDLDALDDQQIDQLYHGSLRRYAAQAKTSAGVLA